jgi:hypothetical protein
VGQDGKEREGGHAVLKRAAQEVTRADPAEPAAGAGPAGLPEVFREEIRTALRYERGLVIKAGTALAVVLLVVLIRLLFLG